MISKLVAWAEDRPLRRSRACGARSASTSSPASRRRCRSSRWLLAQPEFLDGRFHTTYLDEVLKARNGRPFVEPAPEVEEIAAIAAALAGGAVAGGARPTARRTRGRRRRRRAAGGRRRAPKGCADVQYEVEVGGRRAAGRRSRRDGRRFCSHGRRTRPGRWTPRASTRTRCRCSWTVCGRQRQSARSPPIRSERAAGRARRRARRSPSR